ncbi:MAG: hypothetical protein L6Q84_27345 [Polyangiaceae bacterium]|nr:hypothetical protein [Polyangiaceae bacterium]
MIGVKLRPEPTPPDFDFDTRVRVPGNAWLAANPKAPTKDWPPLWRHAMPSLRTAYKGVCAYFCCYVAEATGGGSADHFVPKSDPRNRKDTYEWDNYRFACTRMNSRKRDASDVIDPIGLADGLFVLVFSTMRVKPAAGLPAPVLKDVKGTIKRLKLNSQECVAERQGHWDNYDRHGLSAARFIEFAPFIAMEAARQGLLKPADHGVTVASIRTWLDS